MHNFALSVGVLATLLCLVAGLHGLVSGRMPRRNAYLLLAVAAVLMFNVWMWATMPKLQGEIPKAQDVAAASTASAR